jgi:hypothetical protein
MEVLDETGREIVEHDDIGTCSGQSVDEVRADEAGAAGDQSAQRAS